MHLGAHGHATRHHRAPLPQIARAIASPDVKKKMEAIGYEPAAVPPDEVKARIKADMPKWAKVIRDAGIRP
jgi:tripartite-type tricarboxylate transporter receptor subunit TctC